MGPMGYDPFALGKVHMINLERKLKEMAENPKLKFRMVVSHVFLFGTSTRQYTGLKNLLLPLMRKYNVDLFLNGF